MGRRVKFNRKCTILYCSECGKHIRIGEPYYREGHKILCMACWHGSKLDRWW